MYGHRYHDDWIREHYDKYDRTDDLAKAYNSQFGVALSYEAFRKHLKYIGYSRYHTYTDVENSWLKEYFPIHGPEETAKAYSDRFGVVANPDRLGRHCRTILGLDNLSGKRGAIPPVGTVVYTHKANSGKNVIPMVKTEDGWVSQVSLIFPDKTDSQAIIHLDGDGTNNDPPNLCLVDKRVLGGMIHLWSDNPELNKVSILYCQLKMAIGEMGHMRCK